MDKTERPAVARPVAAPRIFGVPAMWVRRGLIAAALGYGGWGLAWSLVRPQVWQTTITPDGTTYRKYLGKMWLWDWWASNETPPVTWDWHQMPLEIAWSIALTVCLVSVICGFLPKRLVYPKRG